jgi:hypothetical protein
VVVGVAPLQEVVPVTVTCLDTDQPEGRRAHTWNGTGLDIVNGKLCVTRRCVCCGRQEHRPYGLSRGGWRTTRTTITSPEGDTE